MKKIVYIAICLWGGLAHGQKGHVAEEHRIDGYAQGTSYMIKYYADRTIDKSEVDSLLLEIDMSMSLYKKNTLINQFNDVNCMSVRMDKHLQRVIKKSVEVNKLSRGYFDITVFPLIQLWGFGPKGYTQVPTSAQLEEVKKYIGMDKIRTKGRKLYKKNSRVQIDVNGIAQGYTVDYISAYLAKRGIQNHMVELGGEIRAKGVKPDGKFKIMLDERSSEVTFDKPILALQDIAVTTSSIREKNYKVGDRLVSHHIDPRTLQPIQNTNISVTVIAPNAMTADALDNYFMSLQPQNAVQEAEKIPGVEICLYYSAGEEIKVLYTSGFNKYIYNQSIQ